MRVVNGYRRVLVASLYCEPSCRPHGPPASAIGGFLRFLHLLATFDWEADALCVSIALEGEVDASKRVAMEKRFQASRREQRKSSPPMYVVADLDEMNGWMPAWTTATKPSRLELARTCALARVASKVISPADEGSWSDIFSSPPMSDYDVVIHLNRAWLNPRGADGSATRGRKRKRGKGETSTSRGARLRLKGGAKFVNLKST